MPELIPKAWRDAVVRILRTNNDRQIEWTPQALQRWKTDTFGAWEYEAYDGLIYALEDDSLQGNQTTAMPGQLATYEFMFRHDKHQMYGKIALRTDRVRVLILSAHRPERPTLRP